ncbi:DNA repair protein RecN [Dorea amylophila]|jgi:DNA repair protein RecN (Recombination protein N)|uniref:DNA repair protein RecN n=1 Tax=Dorea amylophila TaxID=2981789 RepID=UPI00284B9D28|nr:DNA repair protein RecN [Dorea sp.]
MLQYLHVKNLALIDEIEVEFGRGLNILTGETGAGKSIILGSVNLALGGRYTKDILRQGTRYGLVELTFSVESERQIRRLKELDVYPEDGFVTLQRRLMEGRSVSKINGETVQMATLKAVSAILIDIHGQHEHQSLLYKKNHLAIVDAFAGEETKKQKEKVAETWQQYKGKIRELSEAGTNGSERAKELAFLKFEVDEIVRAELKEHEDEELEACYRRMCNGKKIAQSVAECYQYTGEDGESASEKLGRALRTLSEAVDADEQLSQLYTQLADVDNLLNDFNHELAEYQKNCEFSDEEFYETEKRLNEINHLKTKYGNSYEEIMAYCKKQEERIGILENYDTYMQELEKSCEQLSQKYLELAGKLSALRQKKAKMLEKKIQKGLEDLNFEQVQFEIHFAEKKEYAKDGIDDVEFRISLNQGQPVKPLTEVASGGELSRIMLAIKAVMADKDEIETLIFDEIDVGISGRTAQKVSEKMALIGKEHQVICITHLAQIAAMADRHFLIEKKTEDAVTRTKIYPLNEENSVEELARILGGARITDTVMQSAREMKNLASQMK